MLINRRILVLDTPARTDELIRLESIVIRFQEGDGTMRDISKLEVWSDAVNHNAALFDFMASRDLPAPEPTDETFVDNYLESLKFQQEKLLTVYAIEGQLIGYMTPDGIDKLFELAPTCWISIHGDRDEWPVVPSGEFNRSGWLDWKELNK